MESPLWFTNPRGADFMPSILAVDDSVSMRQLVSFTLKEAGFDVVEAVDGEDGLSKAQTTQVDLVLTDVNMPKMNGIDLIRNLRGLASYKFTPMLLLTTESAADKKAEGKAAGATGWLVKPFDPDQLIATINRCIG
jgi:two-component system chemotaxis response regulator CheY